MDKFLDSSIEKVSFIRMQKMQCISAHWHYGMKQNKQSMINLQMNTISKQKKQFQGTLEDHIFLEFGE